MKLFSKNIWRVALLACVIALSGCVATVVQPTKGGGRHCQVRNYKRCHNGKCTVHHYKWCHRG